MTVSEFFGVIDNKLKSYDMSDVNTVEEFRKWADTHQTLNVANASFWFFTRDEARRLIPLISHAPGQSKHEYIHRVQNRLFTQYSHLNTIGKGYTVTSPDVIIPQILEMLDKYMIGDWYRKKPVVKRKIDKKGMTRLHAIKQDYLEMIKGTSNALGTGRVKEVVYSLVFTNATNTEILQIEFYSKRLVRYVVKTSEGFVTQNELNGAITTTTLKQMKEELLKVRNKTTDTFIKNLCEFLITKI